MNPESDPVTCSAKNECGFTMVTVADHVADIRSEKGISSIDDDDCGNKPCVKFSENNNLLLTDDNPGDRKVDTSTIKIPECKLKLPPQNAQTGWRRYIGQFLTLAHVLAFTLCAVIIKSLPYHPFCIGIWRFQGILLPSLLVLAYKWKSHQITTRKEHLADQLGSPGADEKLLHLENGTCNVSNSELHKKKSIFSTVWPITKSNGKTVIFLMLRCFLGTNSILLFFFSLKYLTVADSTVILSTSPVFVTIIAYFWLKEPCGVFPVFLAVLTVFGIFIVARPPMLTGAKEFNSNTLLGCGLGTAGLSVSVVAFVLIRLLKQRHVHTAIITTTFGFWGLLQSLILGLSTGVLRLPESGHHVILLLVLATLTCIAQFSLTTALKYENAGPVSMIRSTNVIFSFIWPLVFFGQLPDAFSLIGAGIVIICILGTVFRKWLSGVDESHFLRKYLFFVLK